MSVKIPCPCPAIDGPQGPRERHPGGDTVTLRPMLDFRAAMTARNAVTIAREDDPELGFEDILTILTEVYILQGVESWTLVDAKGKPLPVTRGAIREKILSDQTRALLVGDAADDLYAKAVMLPLLQEAPTFSPDTPTDESTSRTIGSSPEKAAPKRPKRSSITISRTDGIVETSASPGGAYS